MIISLQKWIERGKFILLFILLTLIVNHLFMLANQWIHPIQRYKDPAGEALKVMDRDEWVKGNESLQDRLIYFYWYGE